ncbi:MAG: ATPase [Chloroflexota bacterium]|nr:ATPase [Chloroflexota bacterium]NOG65401.1 ATPase [Chloroflexota bacterium]GIK64314.1 MAG: ATPase [Chloroflexota bacterium]
MWPDNETERDFLNFTGVADTVAEIIVQANGRPISIGVSGAWGVGKTSMIKLIRKALEGRSSAKLSEYVFVEFNAWLYQGYDDARAALMEVIASKLEEEARGRKTAVENVQELLKRVDWLRAAKLTAGSVLALGFGLPPVGLIGELASVVKDMREKEANKDTVASLEDSVTKLASAAAGVVKSKVDSSPPKEIQAIRNSFEKVLDEMGIKLVVLIDDLDRCLPSTTISTLEAIRLFLFLHNTAFVIAADDSMIRHAVRQHFEGVEEEHVTNYFDKLIQVPIRVPPLGTQEVRAYIMLLYVETSELEEELKELIRTKVCQQLGQTWRGQRVDRAFMQSIHDNLPSDLIARFDSAERLAPIMTSSTKIAGNPRLIKRFLNALAIRMSIAFAHSVNVDEAALAKMLLFERCGNLAAYALLGAAINSDAEGKPRFLAEWEEQAAMGQELQLEKPWDESFIKEWLALSPRLAEMDLRGALYVSREHAPVITPEDRLSSEAVEILTAILKQPEMSAELHERFTHILPSEMTVIMDRLLEKARQEQEWGTPAILDACLAVAATDQSQGRRLAAFLKERPSSQITASLIPKLADQPWAKELFDTWLSMNVIQPVKRAIEAQRRRDGNLSS